MLVDRFGRPVTNLRVAVTEACNLRCFYCHKEGYEGSFELPLSDLVRVASVGRRLGIEKVKITGGEPLLRRDIVDLVEGLASLGFEEISMTSNGVLLSELALKLAEAGLARVNVSLPSTRPEKYKEVTGVDAYEAVIEGVRAAKECGLDPVKVNFVVLRGVNSDEIEEAIEFARREGVILQLIELEPLGLALREYAKLHEPLDGLEAQLAARAEEVVVRHSMHARRQYRIGDAWVELVKPMHNPEFCAHCTRIRLTADGKLKPCLMRNDNLVDLVPALASGSDEELVNAFKEAVARREPFFGRAAPGCPLSR